jgi:hypothetical protein
MSPGFESSMGRWQMCQQKSAENEICIANREWSHENVVLNELKLRLIDASLGEESLG